MIEYNEIVVIIHMFMLINFCINQVYILYILSFYPLYRKYQSSTHLMVLIESFLNYVF